MLLNFFWKILWLIYRLRILFFFYLKVIIVIKLISISLDIYNGFYPKIFNDLSFKTIIWVEIKIYIEQIWLQLSHMTFFYFLIFLVFFLYRPFFYNLRKIRGHLEILYNLQEEKQEKKKKKEEFDEIVKEMFSWENIKKTKIWPVKEDLRSPIKLWKKNKKKAKALVKKKNTKGKEI